MSVTTATSMFLPVQDVGEVSITEADHDTDDDYFGFSGISSSESSCPVNDINKNELESYNFWKKRDKT